MQVRLLKYSDKRFISLTDCLNGVSERFTVESLHKLRLTIKKLYALVGILRYNEEVPVLKNELNIIDQVYIKSGFLRDNQVKIELLNKYQDSIGEEVDCIVKRLKIDNKKYKGNVRLKIKKINQFDLVLLNQRIDNTIEALSDSSIENILHKKANELFDQMSLIIKNNPNEKALHRIRIKMKELIYTLSIINKGGGVSSFDLTIITYLKKVQLRIGEWHDLKVLIDDVNSLKGESTNLIKAIEFDEQTKLKIVLDELNRFEEMYLKGKKNGKLGLPIF